MSASFAAARGSAFVGAPVQSKNVRGAKACGRASLRVLAADVVRRRCPCCFCYPPLRSRCAPPHLPLSPPPRVLGWTV